MSHRRRIPFVPFAIAMIGVLHLLAPDAMAQSRTAAAVAAFADVNGAGASMPGCGGAGGGNALTTSLNTALGTPGFDDEGVAVQNRRTAYRFCDVQTPTGANGWTGDNSVTAAQATIQSIAFAPEEVFASMDNANASFDLQTANVARRVSLVRLAKRLDRSAAEQLARSDLKSPKSTSDSTSDFARRGPVAISEADHSERLLLALQEGINAGDEIGGEGLGVFLNGRIHIVEGDQNEAERASDGFGGGFTIGADKTIDEHFFAGLAIGYTHIDTNFNNSASESDLDALTFSGYGAYFPDDHLFVDGSISVAYLHVQTSNELIISDGGPSVPSLDGEADGVNFGFDVGVGYSMTGSEVVRLVTQSDELANREELTALSLEPIARLSVLYTEIERFDQTGGDGSLTLRIAKQQTTSVTATLGARTDYAISTRVGVLTPYFRVAYVHEFVNENDDLRVSSVTAPGSPGFGLNAQATDSHYANIGLGVSATLGQGFSQFLDYDVIAGHENVTVHQLTAGVRLEF